VIVQDWERDEIRSANADLKASMEQIQADLDREMAEAGDVYRKLGAMTIRATSPNNLARVTVNSSGVVTEVVVAEDAYQRSTPRQLTSDLNSAIHGAVQAAAKARAQVVEPIQSIVDSLPDLSELSPGTPSLRHLQAQLSQGQELPLGESPWGWWESGRPIPAPAGRVGPR
jgi:DNA-binding protein YbaB